MEVAPRFWQSPETLNDIFVSTSGGAVSGTQATNAVAGTNGALAKGATATTVAGDTARNLSMNQLANTARGAASTGAAVSASAEKMVPLPAVTGTHPGRAPLAVNHQGHFVASTVSFNLPAGTSISEAVAAIQDTMHQIGVPETIHGSFQGTARAAQQSIQSQPLMILAAIIAVYLVLGILYESYVHPLTILSTLPSAGVGAVLALILFGAEFSLIALIGVILLIGIVKKNAIMMVDVALELERSQGLAPREAISEACALRFRPIMMTTMVALLASLPLALGGGDGAELRRPLGIAIVGGLVVSQVLTLYTTPVVYLSLERLRQATLRRWRRGTPQPIAPAGGQA
jgi:multidrug efflux pump